MSLRLSRSVRGCLAAAALACGGLWLPAASAQGQATRLDAEAPTPAASTNSSVTLPPSRRPVPMNGLLRLEEQISRSFQFLKPSGSSLEGVPAPPLPRPMAPVLNRRARELLEQKKNWMFMNPDDLTASPKPEDMFNLPGYGAGALDNKSLSPIERFYQDMDRRNAAKAKQSDPLASNDPRRLREQIDTARQQEMEDPNLPDGIRDKETALRKLLGIDSSTYAPASVREGFSDVFGFGTPRSTPEQEHAQKEYLKGFSDWLNHSTPANNAGLALPPGSADPTRPTTAAGTFTPFNPFNPSGRPDNYDPSIGMVNPTLAASTPQDITTKVLNQWNPYYTPPKVEPPKYQPPAPIFDVPRRKF